MTDEDALKKLRLIDEFLTDGEDPLDQLRSEVAAASRRVEQDRRRKIRAAIERAKTGDVASRGPLSIFSARSKAEK